MHAQQVSFRMVTKDWFTELLLDVRKGSEDSTNGAFSGRQKKIWIEPFFLHEKRSGDEFPSIVGREASPL